MPSTSENRSISRRRKLVRSLSTLVAVAVALVLISTVVLFALSSRSSQHAGQPQKSTITGSASTAHGGVTSYVYQQSGSPIYNLQWSPDGTRIISANENVYGWDAFTGVHVVKYVNSSAVNGKPQLIVSSQLSPDGKLLAVSNIGQIAVYDVVTGKHLTSLTYTFLQAVGVKFAQPRFVPYIGWSLDGKLIRVLVQAPVAGSQSVVNHLVTYTVATGTYQELRLPLNEELHEIAWSPNGEYVAVGRPAAGIVSVLKVATGTIVGNLHAGAPIETIPLSWSPDSHKLVASFDGKGLTVWNATGSNPGTAFYQGGTEPSWSPNGKYIAVISNKVVNILDASTGKLLHTYTSAGIVYALAWSPDSSNLAAGGASADGKKGMVNVWKAAL